MFSRFLAGVQWRFYGGNGAAMAPPVFSLDPGWPPQFFWLNGGLENNYLLQ